MTETFSPNPGPDAPIQVKTALNRLEAEFGDGYSQRSGFGQNIERQSVTLQWSSLFIAERVALRTFFRNHKDGTAFYYTLPTDDAPKKWTVIDFTDTYETSAISNFSASLKQVFDL